MRSLKCKMLIIVSIIISNLTYSVEIGDHDGKRDREEIRIEEERANEVYPVIKPVKSLEDIVEEKRQSHGN